MKILNITAHSVTLEILNDSPYKTEEFDIPSLPVDFP